MKNHSEHQLFVDKFRDATPYINVFRNKIFVIYFSDTILTSPKLPMFVRDLSLLHSLSIKLVLVHGARNLIQDKLAEKSVASQFIDDLRITDKEQIQIIKELYGTIRFDIEALFTSTASYSQQLHQFNKFNNTQTESIKTLNLLSGNLLTAQPLGILNGINFKHTGKVRKINSAKIKSALNDENIILLSPIGFSPTGEAFNLNAEDLATECAIALKADKLIFLSEIGGLYHNKQSIINEISCMDLINSNQKKQLYRPDQARIQRIIYAAESGVNKIQLLNHEMDGALLIELFTNQGLGTLISRDYLEKICKASSDDIDGILQLIKPLEEQGMIVTRARESIQQEIQNFYIIKQDQQIIACAGLYPSSNKDYAELVCLAVERPFRHQGRANKLFEYINKIAKKRGIKKIYALTTQASHWFIEHGFKQSDTQHLPSDKQDSYNYQRNSAVFIYQIDR